MFFTTLRYRIFKLTGLSIFNRKSAYNENILTGETLFSLKQKMKQSYDLQLNERINLSTSHLSIGSSIHEVYNKYGRPAHQRAVKVAETTHDVVMYKRILNGMKTKIIYNFVDEELISVTYHFRTMTTDEKTRVLNFVRSTYLINSELPANHCTCVADANGNKLIYENTFDSTLSFVNNNPEVLRTINAALYSDQFVHSKHQPSSTFELSF